MIYSEENFQIWTKQYFKIDVYKINELAWKGLKMESDKEPERVLYKSFKCLIRFNDFLTL